MATITGLPPQAYTRDTLVKAIEWWNQQPSSLKERATSADAIVSFYLQACRRASASQEAPLSGEAFKADLKNLALGLKQFEESNGHVAPPQPLRSFTPPPAPSAPLPSPPVTSAPQAHTPQVSAPPPTPAWTQPAPQAPRAEVPPQPPMAPHSPAYNPAAPAHPAAVTYHYAPQTTATVATVPAPVTPAPAPPQATPSTPSQPVHAQSHQGVMVWNVDPRSAQAARELQIRLNLGTEIEALRVLITLGMERSRSLFP